MAARKNRVRKKRKSSRSRRTKRSSTPSNATVLMTVSELRSIAAASKKRSRKRPEEAYGDEGTHYGFFDARWEEISPEDSFEVEGIADPREVFTLEAF